MTNTVVTKLENNVIIHGTTTIDFVRHKIENKFIKCDPSLNRNYWGMTEEKSICEICFPNIPKQLKLDL